MAPKPDSEAGHGPRKKTQHTIVWAVFEKLSAQVWYRVEYKVPYRRYAAPDCAMFRGMYNEQAEEELKKIRAETNNEPPMELRMLVLEERSPVAFIANVFRYRGTVFVKIMPALVSITLISSVLAIIHWHIQFSGFDPTLDGVFGALLPGCESAVGVRLG